MFPGSTGSRHDIARINTKDRGKHAQLAGARQHPSSFNVADRARLHP
jgi:hypothetical protein